MAVKAVYAVVKALKPGFIREAVDHLIDELVVELEPFYVAWGGKGALPDYFAGRAGEIADAMLHVTDAKANHAKNQTLRKSYDKLRPSGQKHVEAAVPGVARIIVKHAAQHAA
jgi:hypothetical protein